LAQRIINLRTLRGEMENTDEVGGYDLGTEHSSSAVQLPIRKGFFLVGFEDVVSAKGTGARVYQPPNRMINSTSPAGETGAMRGTVSGKSAFPIAVGSFSTPTMPVLNS
jgi:hypothetical protein